jgi:hypothetical protein
MGQGPELPTLFATTRFLKWIKLVSAVVAVFIARTQIRWLHAVSSKRGLFLSNCPNEPKNVKNKKHLRCNHAHRFDGINGARTEQLQSELQQ